MPISITHFNNFVESLTVCFGLRAFMRKLLRSVFDFIMPLATESTTKESKIVIWQMPPIEMGQKYPFWRHIFPPFCAEFQYYCLIYVFELGGGGLTRSHL